jgi:DnaJ-class molecular chaperone
MIKRMQQVCKDCNGESDQAPNMEAGYVTIVFKQELHPVFERNEDNLIVKQKINLVESL